MQHGRLGAYAAFVDLPVNLLACSAEEDSESVTSMPLSRTSSNCPNYENVRSEVH
jgi:hypothetical protein